jgi:hypothetical protein
LPGASSSQKSCHLPNPQGNTPITVTNGTVTNGGSTVLGSTSPTPNGNLVQYNPPSSFQQPSTTILGGTNLINSGSNSSQCGFNIQTGISVNKQDQANSDYSYGSNMG